MYFAERASVPPSDEILQNGLRHLQTCFTTPASSFKLPQVFETISKALPDDAEMVEYIAGFHPNSQVVACLQLGTYGRLKARDFVASGIPYAKTTVSRTVLDYVTDPTNTATQNHEYKTYALPHPTEVGYFDLAYQKLIRSPRPANMSSRAWQDIMGSSHEPVVERVTEAATAQGNQFPASEIMQAGLRLVCAKKTRPSQLPVVTAPSRLYTAHHVLRHAGPFYSRGVQSVSGALSRGGYYHEWDDWCQMTKEADVLPTQQLDASQESMLLEDGLAMGIRFDYPDVALGLAAASLTIGAEGGQEQSRREPSARLIHGLAIVAHRALEAQKR